MIENRAFIRNSFLWPKKKKKKKNRKEDTNFLEASMKVCRGALFLYLKALLFCCPLFFEDILTLKLLESIKWETV